MSDEYILKETVINYLKYHSAFKSKSEIIQDIAKCEPADVIKVVRCKNCERSEYDVVFEQYWCKLKRIVRPDGFCDLGKPREE